MNHQVSQRFCLQKQPNDFGRIVSSHFSAPGSQPA
jgi:hypothetical protein